jgi:hypothetical protein
MSFAKGTERELWETDKGSGRAQEPARSREKLVGRVWIGNPVRRPEDCCCSGAELPARGPGVVWPVLRWPPGPFGPSPKGSCATALLRQVKSEHGRTTSHVGVRTGVPRLAYEPDCEFEDGVLIERHAGTEKHSWMQAALAAYIFRRRKAWDVNV